MDYQVTGWPCNNQGRWNVYCRQSYCFILSPTGRLDTIIVPTRGGLTALYLVPGFRPDYTITVTKAEHLSSRSSCQSTHLERTPSVKIPFGAQLKDIYRLQPVSNNVGVTYQRVSPLPVDLDLRVAAVCVRICHLKKRNGVCARIHRTLLFIVT